MNRGLFAGTLGSVEYKPYGEGKELATFVLTTQEGKFDASVPITTFSADDIALLRGLASGELLYVEARVGSRTWQSQNGPRTAIEVVASSVRQVVESVGDDLPF